MSGPESPAECYVSGISLRLRDSKRDVGRLLGDWGLEVGRSWTAGEPRATPRGEPLEGYHRECYAYAVLDFPERWRLSASLDHALDGLERAAPQIAEFVESGGYAELFVGWEFSANSGDELGWQLFERLTAMRLALSLDVYPVLDDLAES